MLSIRGGISFLESASTLPPPTVREKGESRSEATSLYCIKLLTYASCTTIVKEVPRPSTIVKFDDLTRSALKEGRIFIQRVPSVPHLLEERVRIHHEVQRHKAERGRV